MSLSPAEQMLYCATKVTAFSDLREIGTGTGFFYSIDLGGNKGVTLFITNNHVVEGANRASISFHISEKASPDKPSGKFERVLFDISGLIRHPNKDVDLCAFVIGAAQELFHNVGKPLFFVSLNRGSIPATEQWIKFDAIERVTMVGCPRGLFDEVNNMPIVRSGATATDISRNFQGKNEFMVDMACFPGSSGSPIFVYDPVGHFDRTTGQYNLGSGWLYFVGILYSGPLINSRGEIELSRKSFDVLTMMHLGQAIRATEVLEIEGAFREKFKDEIEAGETPLAAK